MGISRDIRHKRRATGGKRALNIKKRNHEMGRPASMTKLGAKRIHVVRTRGGNKKYRALRLEAGNFSWSSESVTRKTRVVDVVYNATSNELIRTKTLVRGCIIQIDATPYRQWYEAHYGLPLGKKKQSQSTDAKKEEKKAADAKKAGDAAKKLSPDSKKKAADAKKAGDDKKDAKKKGDDKKGAASDAKKDATKKDATKKDAKKAGDDKKDATKKDDKKAGDDKKDGKKKDSKKAADSKKDEPKKEEAKKEEGKPKKVQKKGKDAKEEEDPLKKKKSRHVIKKLAARKELSKIDPQLIDQFTTGRLFARISSRPGQSGRADGYILEGQELAFYLRKLKAKKGGA